MSTLRFNDGETFDTSGPLRKTHRKDGWYVLGQGHLIPMNTEADCDQYIKANRVEPPKPKEAVNEKQLTNIAKVVRKKYIYEAYEKEGMAAAASVAMVLDVPFRYCEACDTHTPAIDNECVICGQTTIKKV